MGNIKDMTQIKAIELLSLYINGEEVADKDLEDAIKLANAHLALINLHHVVVYPVVQAEPE